MEIRFSIDPERLTLGDLVAIEADEYTTWRERRDLLANHMVDENGEYIPVAQAQAMLSKLTMTQVKEAAQQFTAKFRELGNAQLPPESASA